MSVYTPMGGEKPRVRNDLSKLGKANSYILWSTDPDRGFFPLSQEKICLLTLCICLCFSPRGSKSYNEGGDSIRKIYFRLPYESVMELFQGTGTQPEAVSGKILLLCWWFFLFFMTRMYGSNLTAFLTVDRLKSSKGP